MRPVSRAHQEIVLKDFREVQNILVIMQFHLPKVQTKCTWNVVQVSQT
jgi:hypothetical protein